MNKTKRYAVTCQSNHRGLRGICVKKLYASSDMAARKAALKGMNIERIISCGEICSGVQ